MVVSRTRLAAFWMTLAFAVIVSGCSDNPLGPFEPEINNTTDSFQLQATGVTNRTASLTYDWQNSGTQATVNHSTSTTRGSARVIIRDAANAVVYDKALVPSLTETTAAGTAGVWRIELVLTDYSGSLNFRVQKL
jgi:hypothetical protein